MGFYHTLELADGTDIGGYSKGGSKNEWLLLFTPEEYYQNLKQGLQSKDTSIVKVGCRTSFASALNRLKENIERLHNLINESEKVLPIEMEKWLGRLYSNALYLSRDLRYYDKNRQDIILDMTDGSGYSFIWNEDNDITGIEDWAFINPVEKLLSAIEECEKTTITFDEWLEQLKSEFSDKPIENIGGEFQMYTAHMERGYGPSAVSGWILENDFQNLHTPRQLFEQFVKEWPADDKNGLWNEWQKPKDAYNEFVFLLTDMLQQNELYSGT